LCSLVVLEFPPQSIQGAFMVCPTAQEFTSAFIEAFSECYPATPEGRRVAWQNWTAFMTGKQGKAAGYWSERAVLPLTAKKLGLEENREYLHLDLVMFPGGRRWGNLVVVEHENKIGTFNEEIEKLFSVLAPLKAGISYDLTNSDEDRLQTEQIIRITSPPVMTRSRKHPTQSISFCWA